MKKFISIFLFLVSVGTNAIAQDSAAVKPERKSFLSGFFITGNGFITGEYSNESGLILGHTSLSPILLWKITDKLFFESEVEISLEDKKVTTDIGYATLHYAVNKYFDIGIGKFFSPFGAYQERLHPAWINKFPEAPLGLSHDGTPVGPMAEVGIEIRGGSPLGSSKINYAVYLSNGPSITADPDDPMMAGMLESGKFIDNNIDKAYGGRLGFLPFSNSSLEVGFSYQQAKVGAKDDTLFGKAKVAMHAIDLNYIKAITSLKSIIDVRAQLNNVLLDKGNVQMTTMAGDNSAYDASQAWYTQLAVRPGLLENKILRNFELAGRYSKLHLTQNSIASGNVDQIAFGLNYWITWSSVVKFTYQLTKEEGKEDEGIFFLQLAIGHHSHKRKSK